MFNDGSTVEDSVHLQCGVDILRHIAKDNMDALVKQLLERLGEIVVKQRTQTACCGFLGLATHQTVDMGNIPVDQLTQDVDAQIACGTCNQDVAQLLTFAHAEESQRVALQEVVDGRVVEAGHRVVLLGLCRIDGFTSNQTSQLAWRGIGKYLTIRHVEIGFIGLDDDTSDDERRATEFEEVIGSSHAIHLQDIGEDVAEGTLRIIGRCLVVATECQLWFWQRLDIGLAIGCQRHLV